jgi:hypothetical protein
MVGIGAETFFGPSKWVEGATAGAWSSYNIGGGYAGCHNVKDYWNYCGGTTIVAGTVGGYWRSGNLGRNWTYLFTSASGDTVYFRPTPSNGVFIEGFSGYGRHYFHPNAMIGVTGLGDMLEVSPKRGSSSYFAKSSGAGNGTIALSTVFLPDGTWFGLFGRQSGSDIPNIQARLRDPYGSWEMVAAPFDYYSVDYYKPNPNKLVCYKSDSAQGIYGSLDGGDTWIDKTGNAKSVALGSWGANSCRGLKYVWTR